MLRWKVFCTDKTPLHRLVIVAMKYGMIHVCALSSEHCVWENSLDTRYVMVNGRWMEVKAEVEIGRRFSTNNRLVILLSLLPFGRKYVRFEFGSTLYSRHIHYCTYSGNVQLLVDLLEEGAKWKFLSIFVELWDSPPMGDFQLCAKNWMKIYWAV